MTDQFADGKRPDLERRKQRIEKFGQVAFGGFVVVVGLAVVGLIYAVLDRLVFSGDNPLAGIMMILFLVFAVLMLAYVFLREDLKERRKATPAEGAREQKELATPTVTAPLLQEGEFQPISTVTEHTTELLPSQKSRR